MGFMVATPREAASYSCVVRFSNGSTLATLRPAASNTVVHRLPSGLTAATRSDAASKTVVDRLPKASRQHKTHIPQRCEVVCPWHPWFGQQAWLCESVAKNETVLRCSRQPELHVRQPEIRQGMPF
jgi:hypothetical protein